MKHIQRGIFQLIIGQEHPTPIGFAVVSAGGQPEEAFPAGVQAVS